MIAWLANLLREFLGYFFSLTGNYGVAIIILTVVVRVILIPFTVSQMKAMRRMQEIQPMVEELKKKFKGDQARVNQETMELYRKQGVNPVMGCLPLLLQFPVLIALFQALNNPAYTQTPLFLGLNLSLPDAAHAITTLGPGYYVLPLLAALTTYWQSVVSTPPSSDPSQRMMLYLMPLMIGWFSLRFAAGLSVYWVVSNLFSIAQAYLTLKAKPRARGGEVAR